MSMPIIVAILSILGMIVPTITHAADKPQLPYGVKSAQKYLNKEIAKAKEEYSDAVKGALADYEKKMQREMDKATKAAKLDLAILIKKELDAAKVMLDKAVVLEPKEKDTSGQKTPAGDYDKLPYREYVVDSRRSTNYITIVRGQSFTVVIKPGDGWKGNVGGTLLDPMVGSPNIPGNMRLMIKIGTDNEVFVNKDEEYTGNGRIEMFANDTGKSDNDGSIHLKLVPVRK